MFYLFVLLLGLLGIAAYLLVIFREVPGAVEERLGTLAPLPDSIGQWRTDEASPQGQEALAQGEHREVRLWQQQGSGLLGGEQLVEQVRYRNLATNAICRVEPDRLVKRRRQRQA
jgi:hypothetical protein